jgi:signal transduction histidine kinase
MILHKSLNAWLKIESARLHQESILHSCFGRFRFRKAYPLDDQIKALRSNPLGMFFYNQRAVFLGFGLIFLGVLAVLVWALPSNEGMLATVSVLTVFWVADAALTLLLHRRFREKLNAWAMSSTMREFPSLFDDYFLLDSSLIIALIIVGKVWGLPLDTFAFLLFANTVVYSAYARGNRGVSPRHILILLPPLAGILLLYPYPKSAIEQSRWFYFAVQSGPLLGMSLMTVLSVLMISRLRATENEVTRRRLELLGDYERILSDITTGSHVHESKDIKGRTIEEGYRRQLKVVLKNLCKLGNPFWYDSACVWFFEKHRSRGDLLLPGPRVKFSKAGKYTDGIDASQGFLGTDHLVLLHSIKYQSCEGLSAIPDLYKNVDAPAAFVPLSSDEKRIGVLALFGKEGGPPLQPEEEAFLKSLGSIMSNTIEQWEGRYRDLSQRKIDSLFSCNTLSEVFSRVAIITREYLVAAGCMVLFRPDSDKPEMEIKAWEGFSDSILTTNKYLVGKGQTGKCAETGKVIRFDDVPGNKEAFELEHLDDMEKAHGNPVKSWMALPISHEGEKNYGVIKVINRTSRCSWFRDEDEKLGENIALRLHAIIKAILKREEAEEIASKRQKDLMAITHQLHAPLLSIIAAITNLQRKPLAKHVEASLEDMHDMVEDCLAMCNGTATTFAIDAGRGISFGVHEIDAIEELKKLCTRLRKTNSRTQDLSFYFYQPEGFPILQMDRSVFTSVMYSLIHNAVKYSDKNSQVSILCTFERGKSIIKVRSVGEQIFPHEADAIFDQFHKGEIIKTTGRHHSGVGLGLWVARQLMLAIGGDLTLRLSLQSPRESIFVVHLP